MRHQKLLPRTIKCFPRHEAMMSFSDAQEFEKEVELRKAFKPYIVVLIFSIHIQKISQCCHELIFKG